MARRSKKPAATFAEGIATRVTFDLTFGLLENSLDEFVQLTEEELAEGVRLALRTTHNLAEGAGAAAVAAGHEVARRAAGAPGGGRHVGRKCRRRDAGAGRPS